MRKKQEPDQESDQEKKKVFFFFSLSFSCFLDRFLGRVLFFLFSCFPTFLFSFINYHLCTLEAEARCKGNCNFEAEFRCTAVLQKLRLDVKETVPQELRLDVQETVVLPRTGQLDEPLQQFDKLMIALYCLYLVCEIPEPLCQGPNSKKRKKQTQIIVFSIIPVRSPYNFNVWRYFSKKASFVLFMEKKTFVHVQRRVLSQDD